MMLVVNERTMGRLKAFDGDEDALVNLKQKNVLKQTKPFSLPGKLNASWEQCRAGLSFPDQYIQEIISKVCYLPIIYSVLRVTTPYILQK